jgi:hypothetical protein
MNITYEQAIVIQSALSNMIFQMENDQSLSYSTPEEAYDAIENVKQLEAAVIDFIMGEVNSHLFKQSR